MPFNSPAQSALFISRRGALDALRRSFQLTPASRIAQLQVSLELFSMRPLPGSLLIRQVMSELMQQGSKSAFHSDLDGLDFTIVAATYSLRGAAPVRLSDVWNADPEPFCQPIDYRELTMLQVSRQDDRPKLWPSLRFPFVDLEVCHDSSYSPREPGCQRASSYIIIIANRLFHFIKSATINGDIWSQNACFIV
jgi:hypothetical protein